MNSLVNIFKILSDVTRLRIVVLLAQEKLCVCQLNGILNISQPNVSKNLAKLRDLNLVIGEKKEKFVYYNLKTENVIFTSIINDILNNLQDYPQLIMDRQCLEQKEKYILQCKTNCNYKVE